MNIMYKTRFDDSKTRSKQNILQENNVKYYNLIEFKNYKYMFLIKN